MAGTRWRSANAASPFRCPTGKLRLNCARAREAQADKYFQEIIEIADAATPETVNVARLRVDSRKFTVARLAPKKYGDHISHNVKGPGINNFQPQILIQCSSAGDDEGYIDISAAPEKSWWPSAARQRKFSTGERRAAVSRTSCALLALAAIHLRGSPCAILFWLEAL